MATPQFSVSNLRDFVTVTIANGASLSDVAALGGMTLVGIIMPATWTAADLTFQASHDNSTFNNVYDADDAEVTVEADASRYIQIAPTAYLGMNYLKVRSGTTGSPVNQGGARSVILVVVP